MEPPKMQAALSPHKMGEENSHRKHLTQPGGDGRADHAHVQRKMNSQSRKIFAPAPTHIPTKDNAGEPSFRTKTDRQVLISMGVKKAQ